MMLQTRSSRWACAKTLMVLPLTMLALGAFARTAYVVPEDKVTKETQTITIRSVESSDGDKKLVYIVDGKEVARAEDIDVKRIKSVNIIKDATHLADEYQGRDADAFVIITMRGEGELPDTTTRTITVQRMVTNNGTAEAKVVMLGSKQKLEEGDLIVLEDGKAVPVRIKGTSAEPELDEIVVVGYGSRSKGYSDDMPKALYLLDGVEVKNLDGIDSKTIKSLTVLKDASSVSKYGEKGKNGVVLIETKKPGDPEGATAESMRASIFTQKENMTPEEWVAAEKMSKQTEQMLATLRARKALYTEEEWAKVEKAEIIAVNKAFSNNPEGANTIKKHEVVIITGKGEVQNVDGHETIVFSDAHVETTTGEGSLLDEVSKNNPLYIIDGKVASKKEFKKLKSSEIHAINIYKQSHTTYNEKYGEKATKNGVIDVTTKEALKNKKK